MIQNVKILLSFWQKIWSELICQNLLTLKKQLNNRKQVEKKLIEKIENFVGRRNKSVSACKAIFNLPMLLMFSVLRGDLLAEVQKFEKNYKSFDFEPLHTFLVGITKFVKGGL